MVRYRRTDCGRFPFTEEQEKERDREERKVRKKQMWSLATCPRDKLADYINEKGSDVVLIELINLVRG